MDLFGNNLQRPKNSKKRAAVIGDYDAFVKKFKPKKTTDDCYTSPEIYKIVLDYVGEKYNLEGKEIMRPFYPGGDFENIDYPENAVVIDNPPFSIISKICRFYIVRGIKFFLFCPHMTAFGADIDATYIITSSDITYENGAVIKTSFVSNLFGDVKIIGDADLHLKFKQLQHRNKTNLPKYKYPKNIITVSKIAYCVEKGIPIILNKKDVKHCKGLDAQKPHGKTIYGSGFIVSDRAATAVEDATANAVHKNPTIVWELSEREGNIVKRLG